MSVDISITKNKENKIKDALKSHFETEIRSDIGICSYLIFPDGTLIGSYAHRDCLDYLVDNGVLSEEEINKWDTDIFNEVFDCVRATDIDADENYIGLPEKALTNAQYETLEKWIDNNFSLGRPTLQVTTKFHTDNQTNAFYNYDDIIDVEWPTDYIINKIKKYYATGKLEEDLNLQPVVEDKQYILNKIKEALDYSFNDLVIILDDYLFDFAEGNYLVWIFTINESGEVLELNDGHKLVKDINKDYSDYYNTAETIKYLKSWIDAVKGSSSEFENRGYYEDWLTNLLWGNGGASYLEDDDREELEDTFGISFSKYLGENSNLQEKIVKKGSKWQVQSEKGRNMGTYDTKAEAEERLRQVEYFKHMNEAVDFELPQYLYHATYKPFLKSIKEKGLGNTGRKMWSDSKGKGVVYLSLDDDVAYSYAETAEWLDDVEDYDKYADNIIVLKIDTNKLDKEKFFIDENVLDDDSTVEYHGIIPFDAVVEVIEESLKHMNEDLQETDNEGNVLSKEQIEFFKNSKVRDSSGKLLVCYHGTTENFDTFEKGDIGFHFGTKEASEEVGSFKASQQNKEWHSNSYYLNIQKPLIVKDDIFIWSPEMIAFYLIYNDSWGFDFIKKIKFNVEDLKNKFPESIITKELEQKYKDKFGGDCEFFDILDEHQWYLSNLPSHTRDDKVKYIVDIFKSSGYDGIKYRNDYEDVGSYSYIAFEPNQIKSIDNKNPTNSNNINESDTGLEEDLYPAGDLNIENVKQSGRYINGYEITSYTLKRDLYIAHVNSYISYGWDQRHTDAQMAELDDYVSGEMHLYRDKSRGSDVWFLDMYKEGENYPNVYSRVPDEIAEDIINNRVNEDAVLHMSDKKVNEELDLVAGDLSIPSTHSKKDDRYGHYNYKIEDPEIKQRLVDANSHLERFLPEYYDWYLIAWAKGVDEGTTYQGFLNIYDTVLNKRVHGSYSDGYRPEPDLVKDIVSNSIEEDLDLHALPTDLNVDNVELVDVSPEKFIIKSDTIKEYIREAIKEVVTQMKTFSNEENANEFADEAIKDKIYLCRVINPLSRKEKWAIKFEEYYITFPVSDTFATHIYSNEVTEDELEDFVIDVAKLDEDLDLHPVALPDWKKYFYSDWDTVEGASFICWMDITIPQAEQYMKRFRDENVWLVAKFDYDEYDWMYLNDGQLMSFDEAYDIFLSTELKPQYEIGLCLYMGSVDDEVHREILNIDDPEWEFNPWDEYTHLGFLHRKNDEANSEVDEDLDLIPVDDNNNIMGYYIKEVPLNSILRNLVAMRNVVILPSGYLGYFSDIEEDIRSEDIDEYGNYIEKNCIYFWLTDRSPSTDAWDRTIVVHKPETLTTAQQDTWNKVIEKLKEIPAGIYINGREVILDEDLELRPVGAEVEFTIVNKNNNIHECKIKINDGAIITDLNKIVTDLDRDFTYERYLDHMCTFIDNEHECYVDIFTQYQNRLIYELNFYVEGQMVRELRVTLAIINNPHIVFGYGEENTTYEQEVNNTQIKIARQIDDLFGINMVSDWLEEKDAEYDEIRTNSVPGDIEDPFLSIYRPYINEDLIPIPEKETSTQVIRGGELDGIVILGNDAKEFVLDHIKELFPNVGPLTLMSINDEFIDKYYSTWIYVPMDMSDRFRSTRSRILFGGHHSYYADSSVLEPYLKTIWEEVDYNEVSRKKQAEKQENNEN